MLILDGIKVFNPITSSRSHVTYGTNAAARTRSRMSGSSGSSIGEDDFVPVGGDGVIRKVNIIRINPFSSNLPSFFPKLLNTN